MNKLNSPVVILALIILSVCNMLLSISILTKIKNGNEIVDDADSDNKEQSEKATESTTKGKNENLNLTIYDTSGNKYNSNWQAEYKYNYNDSKENNFIYRCYNIQNSCDALYSVSCNDEQCLLHIYNIDSNGNSHLEDKLYSAEVSKNIIDKFESQEEIITDTLIAETETENGQIVMEFKTLPSYVIIKTEGNKPTNCYYIDDEFLNYINSLRWGSNNAT